ncbi:Rho GTPase-activating protein, putative [Entamoeba invadens IP1]|uniref:Rho GTPase-activating protein, putative n=1 Tax=Entamoeba invadens IP1 TaxID=370355 RepID=UPI0002C3E6A7|nr:Rho GTPase-activating protein, putative [Entamoeba invadens IP1]ELP85140.1 Rho GTPase-activating protein, putative [Entamoeba invadens IP1]|eukprot:XP_004184486.1 Rho GTPase-activating protein, putative [Entamoeba invadens IP1]
MSPPILLDEEEEGLSSVIDIDDIFAQQTNAFIVDTKDKAKKNLLENDTYPLWLGQAQYQKVSPYTNLNLIDTKHTDRNKRPIILVQPQNELHDVHTSEERIRQLYYYLISKLDSFVNSEYTIVYIDKNDTLPLHLVKALYRLFPEKYHKNLYKIYLILNPSIKLKITTSFLLKKSYDKIVIVKDLFDVFETIPVGVLTFPKWVITEYTKVSHPVFGLNLHDSNQHNNRGVSELPIVMECAIQYFSANPVALTTEGIFRLSGNKDRVDYYVDAFNHCRVFVFPIEEDPHVVCSVMKTFLQSMPNPILTPDVGEEIVTLFSNTNQDDDISLEIGRLFLMTPIENRRLLLALVNLARLVADHSDVNRMDVVNLGNIFGPCVYWKDYSIKSINDVRCINAFFSYLIKNVGDYVDAMLETYQVK